jgi:purine-binding chemotaxis protein CheW
MSSPAAALPAEELQIALLLVRLDRQLYGVPAEQVREVARCRTLTPVPGAPAALPGIINQRGTILPVIDPRLLLGLAQTPASRASRLVLVAVAGLDLALLVDAVLDLAVFPGGAIEPLPSGRDGSHAGMLRGLVRHDGELVVLLDPAELVAGLREWS